MNLTSHEVSCSGFFTAFCFTLKLLQELSKLRLVIQRLLHDIATTHSCIPWHRYNSAGMMLL